MSQGPSPHLSWAELACKDGTPYPDEWRDTRAVMLATAFEAVRTWIGAPITVLSAYRTKTHNAKVGGARNSQHIQGRAMDLYPPDGWTLEDFYAKVRVVALDPHTDIRGLGKYPTFVHIDVRPRQDSRCVCWTGNRVTAELKDGA